MISPSSFFQEMLIVIRLCKLNTDIDGLAHQESLIAQLFERPTGIWKAMGSIIGRRVLRRFLSLQNEHFIFIIDPISHVLNEQGTGYEHSISIELKNGARYLKEHPKISKFAKFNGYWFRTVIGLGRYSLVVTHSSAHSRKDRPAQHVQRPGWPEDKLEEDRSYVCECPLPVKDQGSRTGYFLHRQVHIPWKHALPGRRYWCGHTKQTKQSKGRLYELTTSVEIGKL